MTSYTINNKITTIKEREQKVIQGVDMILELFTLAGQPLFPRKMTTLSSNGKMFTVMSREDIIDSCRSSDFMDC